MTCFEIKEEIRALYALMCECDENGELLHSEDDLKDFVKETYYCLFTIKKGEKYFVEGKRAPLFGTFSSAKHLSWIDLIDVLIAAGAGLAVYKLSGSHYQTSGIIIAFLGITSGGLDILMRKREPIFSKIVLLLFSGAGLYIYGRFFD